MRKLTKEQQRLKNKYPELTFTALKMLRLNKINNDQIYYMYGITEKTLNKFELNHTKVLRKVRNWA